MRIEGDVKKEKRKEEREKCKRKKNHERRVSRHARESWRKGEPHVGKSRKPKAASCTHKEENGQGHVGVEVTMILFRPESSRTLTCKAQGPNQVGHACAKQDNNKEAVGVSAIEIGVTARDRQETIQGCAVGIDSGASSSGRTTIRGGLGQRGSWAPRLGRGTEKEQANEEEKHGDPAAHLSKVGWPRRGQKPPHLRWGL